MFYKHTCINIYIHNIICIYTKYALYYIYTYMHKHIFIQYLYKQFYIFIQFYVSSYCAIVLYCLILFITAAKITFRFADTRKAESCSFA